MMLRGTARAGAYYAVSLVMAVPAGLLLKRYGPELGPVGLVGLGALLFAAAHVGFLWYWRGLDEAARAAHKDAFFWGGLAAIYLIALAMLVLRFEPELLPIAPATPGAAFALGMATSIFVFVTVALAAWGVWWLRRR